MQIKIYRPASPLLKDYIDSFYTLVRTPAEEPCTYLSFPGLHTIVCLYTNTITAVDDHTVRIKHQPNGKLESRIVGEFNQPAYISYQGQTSEITILFHPLGLNAFLPRPLKEYTAGHFGNFQPFDDYLPAMKEIMAVQDLPSRIVALEQYWEAKFIGFNHPFLNDVVRKITAGEEPEQSLSALADAYNISRQQLHQQFINHLLKSPSEFRKIVRFRQALKMGNEQQREKLTQISSFVNYFDQSHMIRDFKAVTGYTPKRFFKGLSSMGNGTINWVFQK